MSNWTKEKPTKPGFCWMLEPGSKFPEVVEVSKVSNTLWAYFAGIEHSWIDIAKDDLEGYLWMEISTPELPSKDV